MSTFLYLLPFDGDYGYDAFSHTVLGIDPSPELQEELENLPAIRVPEKFSSFLAWDRDEESLCGNTQEDDYEEPLKFVLAEQLQPFSTHEWIESGFNRKAVWAFLKELPPRTKVALYWS